MLLYKQNMHFSESLKERTDLEAYVPVTTTTPYSCGFPSLAGVCSENKN